MNLTRGVFGPVNACTGDKTVAEERKAAGGRPTAYGSTAESGEPGAVRALHGQVCLLRAALCGGCRGKAKCAEW